MQESQELTLWPQMRRVIEELRPHWVIGENVENAVRMVLDDILDSLEGINYKAQAFVISAYCTERTSTGKEHLSWPRPTTGAPLCGGTHNFNQMKKLMDAGIISDEERRNLTQGNGGRSNPDLLEWLMGFPTGWSNLTV